MASLKPYLQEVVDEANRNRTDKAALGRLYERLAGFDIIEETPEGIDAAEIRKAVFEWCEDSIWNDDTLSADEERAAKASLQALYRMEA
jgi:hypothetical protein